MELHDIVIKAETAFFRKQSLLSSWNETAGFVDSRGYIASGPQIMAMKIDEPVEGIFWKRKITGNTKEISIRYDGQPCVIVLHGAPLFKKTVVDSPDLNYQKHGAKITQLTVENILEGTLPGGNFIEMYHYKNFVKKDDLPAEYGIVLPDNYITPENIAIARFGGKETKATFDRLYKMYIGEKFKTEFSQNHFEEVGRLNFINYGRHSTGPVKNSDDVVQFMGVRLALERILPAHFPIKVDTHY